MKITFCGHSDYLKNEKDEKYLLQLFEKLAVNNNLEFYLGKDGNFDFLHYIVLSCTSRHTLNQRLFLLHHISCNLIAN